METLAETHQLLEKELVNKKNQKKVYVQTIVSVVFIFSIMTPILYFEITFLKPGQLQAWSAALTGGLLLLAAMLIGDKIQKKPFGHNPIITKQEIKNLAKEELEKSKTKLDELNQNAQNLEMLAI